MRNVGSILMLVAVLNFVVISETNCIYDCAVDKETFGFSIDLSLIMSILKIVGVSLPVSPGAELLIPGVEVTISTTFSGDSWVSCPSNCCDGRRLVMDVYLRLISESTVLPTIPPQPVEFSSLIPVVRDVYDDSETDVNEGTKCAIGVNEWEYTLSEVAITLTFLGGLVEVPLVETRGRGKVACIVNWGCGFFWTKPVIVSLPPVVKVPLGETREFQVVVRVDPSYPVWAAAGVPTGPLLDFEVESSQNPNILITVTDDVETEGGQVIKGGKVTISAIGAEAIKVSKEEIVVSVCDPIGRCDQRAIEVYYVSNQPPQAISGSMLIRPDEGCHAGVIYRASRVPACLCLFPWRCP